MDVELMGERSVVARRGVLLVEFALAERVDALKLLLELVLESELLLLSLELMLLLELNVAGLLRLLCAGR